MARRAVEAALSKRNAKKIEIVTGVSATAESKPPAAKAQGAAATGAAGVHDDAMGFVDDILALGLGILAMVLARAVEPGIRDLFQLPKQLYLAQGAAILVALVGAMAWMGRPLRARPSAVVYSFAAFIGAVLLSMLVAPHHTGGVLSLFAEYDAHRWLAAGAVFGVTLVAIRKPRHIWYLAGGLVLGGLIVSLIGIGEQHNILGLLPEPRWTVISKPGSTFGNRNMAAQVVVTMLPACYVAIAVGVRWWVHGRKALAIAVLTVASLSMDIFLYYLMLTVTRSAWLGALIGAAGAATAWAVGLWLARRDQAQQAAAGGGDAEPLVAASGDRSSSRPGLFGAAAKQVLIPLATVVAIHGVVGLAADRMRPAAAEVDEGDGKRSQSVPALVKSFFEFGANHYRWRFGMLASSWEAMKAEPLGGGAGNWRVIYPKYLTKREKNEMFTIAKQPIRAHNDFLQIGSEYGVHGLLAFLALLGSAAWVTARVVRRAAARRSVEGGEATLAFAAMGSLIGILAICGDGMASFPLQLPVPTFLFALHLGIIAAADDLLRPSTGDDRPRRWSQGAAIGVFAAGLITLIYLEGMGSNPGLHGRWMIAERGFTRARNLQKSGQASQGLTEIRKAIAANPHDFQNHFIEALCLNSLGQTKDAIDSLHRSLALYPNLLNAWVNVAMFSARVGDKARMNEAVDRSLELKPDELIALNVRLNSLHDAGENAKIVELVAKQVPGYQEYRTSGNWPVDDGGQLLGAYKQSLNHGLKAARKLGDAKVVVKWLEILDDLGIPNDGRTQEAKDKEWRERALEVAEGYRKLNQADKALPWARRAAELARNDFADAKRLYALTLALNGQFADADHEARVAVRLSAASRDTLVQELKDNQGKAKDAAAWASLLTAVSGL